MSFYFLENVDQNLIGEARSLFGYSKQFKGFQVALNSLFSEGAETDTVNLMQLFTNEGDKEVNLMKVRDEKNCKVKFRNLPGDSAFHFRVEYATGKLSTYYFDTEKDQFIMCAVADFKWDWDAIFLFTANSGMRSPDHYYIT